VVSVSVGICGLSDPIPVWSVSVVVVAIPSLRLASVHLDLNATVVTVTTGSGLKVLGGFPSVVGCCGGEVDHAGKEQKQQTAVHVCLFTSNW